VFKHGIASLIFAAIKEYAIIFIAEYLAAEISSEIEDLREDTVGVTIVSIPDSRGSFGLGSDIISSLTKKALGKEIKISSVPEDKKRKKGYGIASKGLKFEGVF